MHCARGRAPPRSRSLASRYPRRVLNYLRKPQGQRRAARVKAKRKATMFAHAAEKTTQRTRKEKRPASLRASLIARRFVAARKMPPHRPLTFFTAGLRRLSFARKRVRVRFKTTGSCKFVSCRVQIQNPHLSPLPLHQGERRIKATR